MNIEIKNITIDELLLDPNNPRFLQNNSEKISEDFYDEQRTHITARYNLDSISTQNTPY